MIRFKLKLYNDDRPIPERANIPWILFGILTGNALEIGRRISAVANKAT